ncbi:MAG: hypothetical protein FRX49_02714 [Trebouxia sp. A1-2]|nr:MAG: hypothetical protein FRX49_02714 [Trebouxia sp. A1-2]
MVEKEKPAATEVRPVKPSSGLKAEGTQPKTSGGSVQPEPKLPEDAWRCFVTTTKGSKLLLFLKPLLDVKQILSEIAKRHNAQCKELGRIKCKYLAYCQSEDGDGFKLTNDMILQDFAPSSPVYLRAYVEDAAVAKRKATAEGEDPPAKKVKATPAANGAPGSGSAAATSEGPKKRGRPSNKEKAEREAAAAAAAPSAGVSADKGKAPVQTQEKAPAVKKSSQGKSEVPASAPAQVKKPAKATPKTPVETKQPAVDPFVYDTLRGSPEKRMAHYVARRRPPLPLPQSGLGF